jgi:hypothetical protein
LSLVADCIHVPTCTEQVETLLKSQDNSEQNNDAVRQDTTSAYVASTLQNPLPNSNDFLGAADRASLPIPPSGPDGLPSNPQNTTEGDFPWEMIGLGLDEPLPPQDVMDEL